MKSGLKVSASISGAGAAQEHCPKKIISLQQVLRRTLESDLAPFHENRARLQFGVESFNLANHSNPVMLSEFYSTPSSRLGSYKKMIESGTPRQIQFFMQFEY